MECPTFTVDETGAFFTVLVFDDFVIKVPRNKRGSKKYRDIQEIAQVQNDLAQKMDSVLPCEYVDGAIVMPRAPGIRGDFVDKKMMKKKLNDLIEEIRSWGYKAGDITRDNVFYDSESGKFYIIDFHLVKRNKEGD